MMLTSRHVDIGGIRLQVFTGPDASSGPAIVTTHQYIPEFGQGRGWTGTFLGAGRVFAVNGRGAGGSEPETVARKLTMGQMVEDLEALRVRLGLASWVFAGTSTGGMIGLLYALRYPASLRALVLNGSAASWRYILDPDCIYNGDNPYNSRAKLVMAPLFLPKPPSTARRRWAEVILELGLRQKEKLPELLDERGDLVVDRLRAYIDEVRPPDPYDLEGRLGEIRTPTLVTCGRFDNQCPIQQSEILHEGIPNSQLTIFEHSGHFPYFEEPEAFRDAVHRFIGATG